MIVGFNGQCVEDSKAVISVFDHGFLYGMGLFETMRTYGGVPFLLQEHLTRLSDACEQLGIRYRADERELRRHVGELLAANGLQEGYVRISVTAGVQPLGLPTTDYEEPNVIVYVKALPPEVDPPGKPLQLLQLRRNTPEGDIRTKSFHYMNNILAKREMYAYPWSVGGEGLFLDVNGYVAEGIVSNVFFIKARCVYTPSLDTGILPGITRAHVLRLAAEAGIPTEEGCYSLDRLLQADEIFICNSVQELVPIHTVYDCEGSLLWKGQSAEQHVTQQLLAAYRHSIQL